MSFVRLFICGALFFESGNAFARGDWVWCGLTLFLAVSLSIVYKLAHEGADPGVR